MDYRYLKAFYLTSQHSSFSKAASELRIAQSAVSRQVKLLESSVDRELIIRSSKKVILTDHGEKLYQAIAQFENITTEIFEREDTKPLRIGILEGLLLTWFQPILSKFQKKYGAGAHIEIRDLHLLRSGLEKGKYDVIFTNENIQTELMSSKKLFRENMCIISAKEEIQRKKLHEYPWIVYGDHDIIFKVSRKTSQKVMQVGHLPSIINLVKQNNGIAIVPSHIIKKSDNLVTQEVSLGPDITHIYLATLNFRTLPKPIKILSDVIEANTESKN